MNERIRIQYNAHIKKPKHISRFLPSLQRYQLRRKAIKNIIHNAQILNNYHFQSCSIPNAHIKKPKHINQIYLISFITHLRGCIMIKIKEIVYVGSALFRDHAINNVSLVIGNVDQSEGGPASGFTSTPSSRSTKAHP